MAVTTPIYQSLILSLGKCMPTYPGKHLPPSKCYLPMGVKLGYYGIFNILLHVYHVADFLALALAPNVMCYNLPNAIIMLILSQSYHNYNTVCFIYVYIYVYYTPGGRKYGPRNSMNQYNIMNE